MRLLRLVQLGLLSGQDLLLLSQDLGVVLALHRCCSLGSRSALDLGLVRGLANCDVLGALPVSDPHLLPLVLEVELLCLARGALRRLRMVVQLKVLLLVHVLHFLVAHQRSGSSTSMPRVGRPRRILIRCM